MIQLVTPPPDAELMALRLPPHAVEAEQSILGGLLLDNAAWDRIGDLIDESDFYRRDHRLIYRHIERLIAAGFPADALTVAESLGADLQEAGGQAYIGHLALNTPSAANIARYAEIVKDRAQKRGLIALCNELTEAAYGGVDESAAELVGKVQDKLFALAQRHGSKAAAPFRDILSRVVQSIDDRAGKDEITGLSTGFLDLDAKTAGFQPGDLIIIAGRPSMGKTALAMNIVEHVALDLKRSAAVFSLEMSDEQLVQRMLGSVGKVNQHQLRTGRLTEDDWARVVETSKRMHSARIVIEEIYDLGPADLRAKARRIQRENPDLGLIVVDYLQLMEAGGDKRADQVAVITRALKRVAKELNIPVVALSQLNRSLEQRTNKRPMMSDLRESGAIEQDADLILFMYREEVYEPETPNPGVAEVIIGKQRNGPTGHINLTFLAKYARFENFAGQLAPRVTRQRSRAFEEPRRRADIDG